LDRRSVPLIGSLVAASAGWRWIFLINLPIGILGLALAWRFLPSPPVEPHPRFDWAGFFRWRAQVLGAALFGMSALGDHFDRHASGCFADLGRRGGSFSSTGAAPFVRLRPCSILGSSIGAHSGSGYWVGLSVSNQRWRSQLSAAASVFNSASVSASSYLGRCRACLRSESLIMRGLAPGLIDRFGFRTVLAAGTLVSGCEPCRLCRLPELFAVAARAAGVHRRGAGHGFSRRPTGLLTQTSTRRA
jgi:hypothetical protein